MSHSTTNSQNPGGKMTGFRTTAAALILAAGLALTGCSGPAPGLPEGLPAGFQLAPGEVSNAVTAADNNWSFSVQVEDEEAQRAAVQRLTDAGYRVLGENETATGTTYSLSDDRINATLVLTQQDDRHLVIYNLVRLE